MLDSTEESGSVTIAKSAEKTTPGYFKEFMESEGIFLSIALREGNTGKIEEFLKRLSKNLPIDKTFKEIASFICRRKNGDLYISTVEGNIDTMDVEKVTDLVINLVQQVPEDTEQILFLHTHPTEQFMGRPVKLSGIGFSSNDERFIEAVGPRFRIFDLKGAYVSLSTANTDEVVLRTGKNEGRAFGWSFNKATPE